MKRTIALLLALLLLMGLTACGEYEGESPVGTYYNSEGLCLQIYENGMWAIGDTDVYGTWEYGEDYDIHMKDNRGAEYTISLHAESINLAGVKYGFRKESSDPNTDSAQRYDEWTMFGRWYVIEEGVSREHYPSGDDVFFDGEGEVYTNGGLGNTYTVEGNQLTIKSTGTFTSEQKKFANGYTYTISRRNDILTLQYPGCAPLRYARIENYDEETHGCYYYDI